MNRLRQHSRRETMGFMAADGFVLFLPLMACASPALPLSSQDGRDRPEPSKEHLNAEYLEAAYACHVGGYKEKAIFIYLAHRQNPNTGQCNPSLDTIARDCEVPRRTVSRCILRLEAAGFLNIKRKGRTSHYLVCLRNGPAVVPQLGTSERPELGPAEKPIVALKSKEELKEESKENTSASLFSEMRRALK